MDKMNKFNKGLYAVIFSIISMSVFIIKFEPYNSFFLKDSALVNFFTEFENAVKGFDIIYVTIWFFMLYFYFNVYLDGEKFNKKKIFCVITSIVLAIVTILGKSYSLSNSLESLYSSAMQIFKTIVFSLGYYLIYYALLKKLLSIKLNNEKNVKKKRSFIVRQIDEHPIRTSIILIFLMWLPFIVFVYPGMSTGDTFDELSQFFHYDTWSLEPINLINEDVYINKHHSVFHTVIIGTIFKIGRDLVSFRFGAFIYTVLQVATVLSVFAFMIYYMKKNKINNLILFLSILFIGLNPTVMTFAICAIKDTPSAIFTLLYVIYLLQIVRNFDSIFKNKLRIIGFIITILLVLLLRNNGIYTFLLSFPFLFLLYKNKWKKLLLVFMLPLIIFGLYDKVLLPSYDISEGSIRETLSIPVMQLARVIKYKGNEFTEEDIEIIDKVFSFKYMGQAYDPDISDHVKNLYNKDSSKEELIDFFGVWFKYLKKYPFIYIESVINSTYGYFYPGKSTNQLYLYGYNCSTHEFLNISPLSIFSGVRQIITNIIKIFYRVPFFINQVAYYDWLLIFSCIYIMIKKKWKYLIPLTPLLATLLSCLASPVNGSFRYILPIVFSVPIIITINYIVHKESGNN